MRRRWIRRIVVCLVLGAVTTVAVAWGLSYRASFDRSTGLSRSIWRAEVGAPYSDVDGSGTEVRSVLHTHRAGGVERVFLAVEATGEDLRHPTPRESKVRAPSWSNLAEQLENPRGVESDPSLSGYLWTLIIQEASGWPCLAMQWQADNLPGYSTYAQMIPIEGWPFEYQLSLWGPRDQLEMRALPLRPVWRGFLLNTLLYAPVWIGPILAAGVTKRAIRRRRGRCEMCGYDLRGQEDHGQDARATPGRTSGGCPECGWGRGDDEQVKR